LSKKSPAQTQKTESCICEEKKNFNENYLFDIMTKNGTYSKLKNGITKISNLFKKKKGAVKVLNMMEKNLKTQKKNDFTKLDKEIELLKKSENSSNFNTFILTIISAAICCKKKFFFFLNFNN
jgi:hypothetical protein